MGNTNEELEIKLRRLTQAYAKELPTKIQEIAAGWMMLKSGWQRVLADEVYRSTHSLSGSSGSYGAMEVHSLSRMLEKAILAAINSERPPLAKEIAEIDNLVGRTAEAANSWVSTIATQGNNTEEETAPAATTSGTRENDAPVNMNPETSQDDNNAGLKEFRILYIEDNRANLNLVKQLIHVRWPEAKLSLAEDPVTGLDFIANNQFDIVLLDINLPIMSGLQVLARIRENDETRHLPVVAVSANAMPADIESGLKAGFDDYITKPIQIDAFFEKIDQIVTKKSG